MPRARWSRPISCAIEIVMAARWNGSTTKKASSASAPTRVERPQPEGSSTIKPTMSARFSSRKAAHVFERHLAVDQVVEVFEMLLPVSS